MRVVFLGTPEFAVPTLERLIRDKYHVVAVYTQPDRSAGRGRPVASPPVKAVAEKLGLPVFQPMSLKQEEVAAQLAELRPDVIVVAAFGQVIPSAILSIPPYGCINIHPSLLPRYRGASPVASAILVGDDFTGVSIMLLDEGLDTGPVLAREKVEISPQDSAGSLMEKLSLAAADMLPGVLLDWTSGKIAPQPQNEVEATYSGKITKEQGEIDWHQPAVNVWRQVRAFNPWPGCYTRWRGRLLKVIEAVPLPGGGGFKVGQVLALEGEGAAVGICAGEGVLGILKVQLEGKRAISAAEFLRGQKEFIGAVLPS